jgi:hypothetical protein
MRHGWIVWASMFIAVGVIINEARLAGHSQTAGIIIALCVAIILPCIYLIVNKRE